MKIHTEKKKNIHWNTMRILAAGFAGAILLGALLLMLPICNNEPIAFMDALFTSTTAICVTGLITIVPMTQLTVIGKVVLCVLIQIGGLGVIACVTGFFLLLRRKITLGTRVVIAEAYSAEGPGGMVLMIKNAVLGTFLVEFLGALIYATVFIPKYGVLKGIGVSVFQSISSFCNAGIDIVGATSFAAYVSNPVININTMLLIILGGIGFPVWFDVIRNTKRTFKESVPKKRLFTALQLHSKIALTTTGILLVGGTLFILLFEYHNQKTMGNLALHDKVMSAAFQSVTARTAGYYTLPQDVLHDETKFLTVILMLIGGSPGGTAGGIKTTTMAMLVLTAFSFIRGGTDTEAFGRQITKENFRTGFTVVMLVGTVYIVGTIALLMIESDQIPFIDILYETASAMGTVGLSANLTPSLSRASQLVLIMMMYLGRIGPLTFALVFGGKALAKDHYRELPKRRILIG
ncbi:potassium uptake TrkH family protein [Lachnospiraceae bacterium PF1-21]|uniref:TrkH family potassium uptake protein n=1 Tax=Ohessyouella blattaphilus TaxID=2949333 RepID=UPI003E201DC5